MMHESRHRQSNLKLNNSTRQQVFITCRTWRGEVAADLHAVKSDENIYPPAPSDWGVFVGVLLVLNLFKAPFTMSGIQNKLTQLINSDYMPSNHYWVYSPSFKPVMWCDFPKGMLCRPKASHGSYLLNSVCCFSSGLSERYCPLETKTMEKTLQHHNPTWLEPSPSGTEEPHL